MDIAIPSPALVVLIGGSGSGKSTFAARHFDRYETVSGDHCRALVSGDEADQSATRDAFDVLDLIVAKRLAAGRTTVVDATSLVRRDRNELLDLAERHGVPAIAVVLTTSLEEALRRNRSRERKVTDDVVRRHHHQLEQTLPVLPGERFAAVHVVRDDDVTVTVTRARPPQDRRDLTGPFDVIGDVHGCRSELVTLLRRLGYEVHENGATHPDGRTAVLLGDLVDRGPDSPGVLRLVMGMSALVVMGNHEHKLVRALEGRNVKLGPGLAATLEQLSAEPPEFRDDVLAWLRTLPHHLVLDGGRLVVAHAGLAEELHGRDSGRVRSFALFGATTGAQDEYGLPVRLPWQDDYRGAATVLYGHTPVAEARWTNNTMCLDTGCVFGGRLSALRWPERELVQVPAERTWFEPVRPLS